MNRPSIVTPPDVDEASSAQSNSPSSSFENEETISAYCRTNNFLNTDRDFVEIILRYAEDIYSYYLQQEESVMDVSSASCAPPFVIHYENHPLLNI